VDPSPNSGTPMATMAGGRHTLGDPSERGFSSGTPMAVLAIAQPRPARWSTSPGKPAASLVQVPIGDKSLQDLAKTYNPYITARALGITNWVRASRVLSPAASTPLVDFEGAELGPTKIWLASLGKIMDFSSGTPMAALAIAQPWPARRSSLPHLTRQSLTPPALL
jgi:hypothetical protein